ncbi:MAG TPA: hypothetical protein VFQ53_02750 [Kofleriaceae bacterium]|nr:hypothetical protein [Kofleriaceae bacterium]
MRTSAILASLFGLSLVACAGQIDGGGGGGGDDDVGADCGNGQVDTGETCDDGNAAAGDGCSATCQTELSPRVTATIDKQTIATELGKTEMLTLTLTSVDGFSGAVTVTPSLVDAANAPLTGVATITGPTSVTLAADQISPSQFSIAIPSDATGTDVTAKINLAISSTAGSETLSSNLTVAAVLTAEYAANLGADIGKHPDTGKTFTVKRGAVLRFKNLDTTTHITHGGGIFPHEDTTNGGQTGGTYEVNTIGIAPGQTGTLGCHSHGDATYATITVQ